MAIQQRRAALGWSADRLAEATGIPVGRLDAIEEGDTATLAGVLRLSHALLLRISVDTEFGVRVTPADEPASSGDVADVTAGQRVPAAIAD